MNRSYTFPLIIIGIFFFIFGFVTWLNGILIPYLKIACELKTDVQAYLVTFAFYISYFVMALPSAWVLNKIGFKNGMSLGLVLMALGAVIFIPAANTRAFELFLLGLFVQGTGLAILQTAANPYVAVLGSPESAAQRISMMGIANKVAGIISPIVLGSIILSDVGDIEKTLKTLEGNSRIEYLSDLSSKVIIPYAVMALVLVLLALMLRFAKLPQIEESKTTDTTDEKTLHSSVLAYPQLVLGVIALFLYVGVEVMAGDTIAGYAKFWGFTDVKYFTSYTLAGMLIGYVIAIFTIPKYISQEKTLTISAVLGVAFSLVAIFTEKEVSIMAIALLGLANSVMWPAIFPLAIADLGKFTKTGSAMLIMAIAGGAILPLLYGALADNKSIGLQNAYWLLVPAYLFIAYYGYKGYQKRKW
jgi:glucose/galactose transporter